jgi:putative transposase
MRIPRRLQLSIPNGFVHKYWRCHNKEYYLAQNAFKALYLQCLKDTLKKSFFKEHIKVSAYCAMDNHFHQVIQYLHSFTWLSDFMRQAHSQFGRAYNKIHKRSGKVAEGRPKTPLIQDSEHFVWVHFYVEANPIRAKKIPFEKMKHYKYSSYRFYAYGIKDEYTEILTPPDWYLALGSTAKLRQKNYRRLFVEYLKSKGLEPFGFMEAFIGSPIWRVNQKKRVEQEIQQARKESLSSYDSS